MAESNLNIDDNMKDRISKMESGLYGEEEKENNTSDSRSVDNSVFSPDSEGLIRGWTRINPEIIPSGLMFTEHGASIQGKPATTNDIRHFTPISEDASFDTTEKINFILSQSIKVTHPSKRMSYKDILELDKIFYMLAIRDMTFYKIPNPLLNISKCPKSGCGEDLSIKVMSSNSSFFEMTETLKRFYSEVDRCFILDDSSGSKPILLSPPTIGRNSVLKQYKDDRISKGIDVDLDTLDIIKYIHMDWRDMDSNTITNMLMWSMGWSIEQESAIISLIREIKKSFVMTSFGVCPTCGAEVTVPFRFQGGFRDFFLIRDILERY